MKIWSFNAIYETKMKIKQPKESEIQKMILDYMRLRGIFCWKNNSVGIFKQSTGRYIKVGIRGISDIIGITPQGRLIAVEVKRPGNHPTHEQKSFLEQIKAKNGIGLCVHSLEELERSIKEKEIR